MEAPLTELEGAALGLIWEMGPATAYAIRMVFQRSPNPNWSGSAGAIYPLVRRLEGRGLVTASEGYDGKRRRELIRITDPGRTALDGWIREGISDWASAISVDPLRTRIRFLRLLSQSARVAFLNHVRDGIGEQIRNAEAMCASIDPATEPFRYATHRGVVLIAKARLEWTKEVEELLIRAAT